MALIKLSIDRLQRMELADLLLLAEGNSCELRQAATDRVVLSGVIDEFDGKALKVVRADGLPLPSIIYNTVLKLNFRIGTDCFVSLTGQICGSCDTFWKIDGLSHAISAEARAAYRQTIRVPCLVSCINEYKPHPSEDASDENAEEDAPTIYTCQTINISLTGVQLRSPIPFRKEDRLLITNLRPDPKEAEAYSFTCQPCWASRGLTGDFLLGCRFEPYDERTQDRLCRTIFQLQSKDIKKRR